MDNVGERIALGIKLSYHLNWELIYSDFLQSRLSTRAFHKYLMEKGLTKYTGVDVQGYVPAYSTMVGHFKKLEAKKDGASQCHLRVFELTENSFRQELRLRSDGVEFLFSCDDPAKATAEVLHHLKALEEEAV